MRLGPWNGEANTGRLVPLSPGIAVADASVTAAIEAATARGYRRLRTSALSSFESEPFLRIGFWPCQQLALLARSMEHDLFDLNRDITMQNDLFDPNRDITMQNDLFDPKHNMVIRRARRRDRQVVLAVDRMAFDPFWRFGQIELNEALRATPQRRFRIAHRGGSRHNGGTAVTGYAISGRSGRFGYLQRLAVTPNQQGQGIGAALVIDGLQWMARRGVTRAWVNTPGHNDGALRFYQRLGFKPTTPGLQILEMCLEP